jgi:hypothetical protein
MKSNRSVNRGKELVTDCEDCAAFAIVEAGTFEGAKEQKRVAR